MKDAIPEERPSTALLVELIPSGVSLEVIYANDVLTTPAFTKHNFPQSLS